MFLVKFEAAFATFGVHGIVQHHMMSTFRNRYYIERFLSQLVAQEANATSESLANEKKYFERHSESKVHRIYLNHSDA